MLSYRRLTKEERQALGIPSSSEDVVMEVESVIKLEQQLAAEGTPLAVLMRRAGNAVTHVLLELLEAPMQHSPKRLKLVIFAGSGNNGGDGWVVAEDLAKLGHEVVLVTRLSAHELSVEPAHATACEVAKRGYEEIQVLVNPAQDALYEALQNSDAVVDSILGTGFSGDLVKEPYAQWITALNEHKTTNPDCVVVAVDIPSGLSADSGTAATPCVIADCTVTMLVFKPGLLEQQAKHYVGDVRLARIADYQLGTISSQQPSGSVMK